MGQSFVKNEIFCRLLHCSPIENVWEICPIKIDFGWPNGNWLENGKWTTVISSAGTYISTIKAGRGSAHGWFPIITIIPPKYVCVCVCMRLCVCPEAINN